MIDERHSKNALNFDIEAAHRGLRKVRSTDLSEYEREGGEEDEASADFAAADHRRLQQRRRRRHSAHRRARQ